MVKIFVLISDIEDWEENKRKLLTIREKLAAMIPASRSDSDSASSNASSESED